MSFSSCPLNIKSHEYWEKQNKTNPTTTKNEGVIILAAWECFTCRPFSTFASFLFMQSSVGVWGRNQWCLWQSQFVPCLYTCGYRRQKFPVTQPSFLSPHETSGLTNHSVCMCECVCALATFHPSLFSWHR